MSSLAMNGGHPYFSTPLTAQWPVVDETDEEYVLASLRGSDHSYGPNCRLFENEFADWNGSRFAVNTNSGTSALHMCLASLGCGAGDEVLVPAYSWSSTATVVLHNNSIPVFVDVDWATCSISPALIEEAITPRTKAIIVAHLHGTPAAMPEIVRIAEKHDLYLIEDACQSHGAVIKNIRVGNWGHCAAFSFNQNKTVCAGDAGMFVTNDAGINEAARRFWSFGENSLPHEARDYHAYALGWMYRSNDLTASFGRAQLMRADKWLQWQQSNAALLTESLTGNDLLILPTEPKDCVCTYSSYVIRLALNVSTAGLSEKRDAFVRALEAEGLAGHVATWQRYILPDMTVFRARNAYGNGCPWACSFAECQPRTSSFPVSQKHCDSSFCLNTILRREPDRHFVHDLAECILKVADNVGELWKH